MMKNLKLTPVIFVFILLNFSVFVASLDSEAESIFSIRIIDFKSPVKLGEFSEFSYFTRSVSGVDGTAEINFWIEKDGEIITSGSDNIYLGNSEEKDRTTKIFIPSNFESGVYELKVEANYKGKLEEAHRTIQINVKQGFAGINGNFGGKFNISIVIALTMLAVLNIYVIYRLERGKINKALIEEKRFIKRHKLSVLTLSFFLILGVLVYYLNLINFLPEIPIYFYYLFLGVVLLLILVGKILKNPA